MPPKTAQERLVHRLAQALGQAAAHELVSRLTQEERHIAAVLALMEELEDASSKAAMAAMEALSDLDRHADLSLIIPWLDLGVTLAETSGGTALKYFKDSPVALGLIEPPHARTAVLTIALEVAEQDANLALEYLRTSPRILAVLQVIQMKPWLELGLELIRLDVVVGLEYIRQIPALGPLLPVAEVRDWLSFGMKLIGTNSLGKPDYMATIEFLRTSPAILRDIEHPAVRSKVIAVGASLAQSVPETAITVLAESPRLLRALPSVEWQVKVLQYGLLLAEKDAATTLSYFRRCPEIVGLIGDRPEAASRFEDWFKTGMEVLAYSPDGALAYFAMESQKALSSLEEALSGVPLRQVARRVKFFVQALCGAEVAITALSLAASTARATVSADGSAIALPAVLRRYPTAAENERLYLVMAAHEAGHLEFGTYRLTLQPLADLIEAVRERYGRIQDPAPESLAAFFRLYPHPQLLQDLWIVLEDARIEGLLRSTYPGLKRDLEQLAAEAVSPRDPGHGLTAKELIVDCLLRLSTGEPAETAVPHAVKDEVSILWKLCQRVFSPEATAETAVRCADDVYARMEELLAPKAKMIGADATKNESSEAGLGPTSSERTGDEYRGVTNWMYRGAMNPEFIKGDDARMEEQGNVDCTLGNRTPPLGQGRVGSELKNGESRTMTEEVLGGGRSLPSVVDELLALEVEPRPQPESTGAERSVRYPEWDYSIRDYRINWCRVIERPAEAGSDEFVSVTLAAQHSSVKSLRRFFQSLRPPAFRRVPGQADGEDVDIDAAICRAAELRAGLEGGDRMYVRREKRDRNVAVAFLIDVSGSTARQIESGRRVIDIEKESLVLLCEALEGMGDQYGLYAYSGHGRASVEFLTLKDFDERLGPSTAGRIGGLGPRRQNRDGAAIRHATAKLLKRHVKTRLLILLSDGRPLDDDYKDEYALQDTKAALREAARQGIDAFCVTIDREADVYLRRMYGEVQYAVIDRIETLPMKLPRIYRQLTT